jgi:hypothetical protein
MCVCGFIEKNINVYPLYKHAKVLTNFQYGHFFLVLWMYGFFLMFVGISDTCEKNGSHVLNF